MTGFKLSVPRWKRGRRSLLAVLTAGFVQGPGVVLAVEDVHAMFKRAEAEARVGTARKTKPVDVRPARLGEIIVTTILGEGVETTSPPAAEGDMVVRNRCAETGNEQILVAKAKFADRYELAGRAGDDGWQEARPRGVEMDYFVVRASEAPFTFMAPWGEAMVAKAGDIIVRNPADPADMYRIARAAFACTYEVLRAPKSD